MARTEWACVNGTHRVSLRQWHAPSEPASMAPIEWACVNGTHRVSLRQWHPPSEPATKRQGNSILQRQEAIYMRLQACGHALLREGGNVTNCAESARDKASLAPRLNIYSNLFSDPDKSTTNQLRFPLCFSINIRPSAIKLWWKTTNIHEGADWEKALDRQRSYKQSTWNVWSGKLSKKPNQESKASAFSTFANTTPKFMTNGICVADDWARQGRQ